ncbi:MAG: nuclear transport factor 2 family protein [Gammaproteobacteria bacterium]|nr:nuclear transport factor 2 family protein [Gammaproteobacteria bacterium]
MRTISKVVFVSLLFIFSAGAYAQSAAEKAALDTIDKYWQARNDQDFKTQAALGSDEGTLDANSDGSFFRTSPKVSAEELAEVMLGTQATKVFYPEATELARDVVMVRYYLEGVVESPAGTVPNYRTRVTTVVVKESGGWKIRAWHFSPLHDGGRHLTYKTDFED